MSSLIHRREFLVQAGALGAAHARPAAAPVRVGMVGVGNRGTALTRTLLTIPDVEIPAVCDINEANAARAQAIVEKAGRRRPEAYTSGMEDFRRLAARNDLDAVINATPWDWHTPIAIASMQAGKYAGVEVPAALTVEDCWKLVDTSEKTGVPCMMLENVCYFRNVLMVLNMIRQGVLGELLHCEAGYQHYIKSLQYDKNNALTWRYRFAAQYDRNQYPTHPIGPVAWWMNINRGDRFLYLTSMSSNARGAHLNAERTFGPGSEAAKQKFAQGDVNTTMIKTANGLTVTLYYNIHSPRPYDLILRVQGTEGIYSGTLDKVYVEGRGSEKSGEPAWEDAAPYYEKYEHPLWKKDAQSAAGAGHGGADYFTLRAFVNAVRDKRQTPIDVYDTATWSVITPLTGDSVAKRSAPVDFPDFTRGKWRTAKPVAVEG